ncbi:MAG: HAD family hydrolase, partial [Pseudomonadota bacterium]
TGEVRQSMPPFIIFDLDDTLYAERDFAVSAFTAIGQEAETTWGVHGLADEMTRLLDAGHLGSLFAAVMETHLAHVPKAEAGGLLQRYRDHRPPQLDLHDDAAAVLEELASRCRLGLITDGHAATQAAKVDALGIARRFEEIIYTGGLGPDRAFHKPHPRAFELMASALAAPHGDLVYVGDNPAKDFVAPNALGWRTVQVVRPARIHAGAAEAEGGAPQHRIDSLDALVDLLKS